MRIAGTHLPPLRELVCIMTMLSKIKTVQAQILEYAEAIGWIFVSRTEAV